jgi:hypothetical protein
MSETLENTQMPPKDTKPAFQEKRKWVRVRRISRFVGRTLGIFALFFLLLALLIQLPPVQRWGVEKTTAYLSKKLNTKVAIGDFRLDFFDEISIGNIYIANQNPATDTILSVGRLRIDVNYFNLIWQIYQLDAVKIEDVTVRVKREVGQYDYNFQFILDSLANKNKTETQKPQPTPDIRFGQIHLRNVDIISDDRVVGEELDIKLKAADIHTNIINLPNNIIDLTKVNLFNPYFHLSETVGTPLPPRPKKNKSGENKTHSTDSDKEKAFQFLVGAVYAENGIFRLDNWDVSKVAKRDSTIDFDHLVVNDINIAIHNFMFTKDEWTGVVDGISLKERSGFVLNKLTCGDAKVTPTETSLYGLQIETPYSVVGDTFRMIYPSGYSSFFDYDNKVSMYGGLHTSKVLINDVLFFSRPLRENPFFYKNRYANARVEAIVFGPVNGLKVRPFSIGLGDGFVAEGMFDGRNLDDVNEAFMNINLKELRTDMTTLRQLIPDFKPHKDFDKLGNLNYNGEFIGFLSAFTTKGHLETALGAADMDMSLLPPSDTAQANYNGKLSLDKFNLGILTGVPDIGRISMQTNILRGVGFTKEKLQLDLNATVDNFQYKNYDYRNFKLEGQLSQKMFIGKFESKDPNIDLGFDGTVNFESDIPIYKFKSNIQKLDLFKLNLLKQDYALSGNFNLDFSGDKLSNIAGGIDAHNILIVKDKTENYKVDSLVVKSIPNIVNGVNNGSKMFSVRSEIGTVDLTGDFSLDQIPDAFKFQFAKFHPRLAADLGLKPELSLFIENGQIVDRAKQQFDYKVFVNNTKNLTQLFDKKLDTLRGIKIEGLFDDVNDQYKCSIVTTQEHRYDDIRIADFTSTMTSKNKDIDWNLYTSAIKLPGGQDLRGIAFQNMVTADTIQFGLTSPDLSTAFKLKNVEINAVLMHQDSSYKLSFGTQSRLKIFNDLWDIDPDNFIIIDKDKLEIGSFDLHSNEQTVTLSSVGNRGLSAILTNFDIRVLNQYLDDDRFVFSGKYKVVAAVEDVFKMDNFAATAMLDSLVVTGENRGTLRIEARGKSLEQPIEANITLLNDSSKVVVDGFYYPSVYGAHSANSIDFNLGLTSFPFKTLKLLIEEGASDFKGRVDGSVHVDGPINAINTNGSLRLRDASVMIDYLKVPIIVKDETVRITNTEFNASGAKVYDKYGNVATIQGGLTHNRFEDFGLKLRAYSPNFLFLNTTIEDNPLYYGRAIGEGDITFSGDFLKTDIRIKAKAGKGRDENRKEVNTNITFPFINSQTASDAEFIVFKNKNQPAVGKDTVKQKVSALNGVNLDLDLDLTPDAEANLIFDEVAGDNIKARGKGNFRIKIDRGEDLVMNGEYQIERGDYLFTLFRLVNKNFAIKRGGTIRWNGTPFDATLNIDAEYKDLTTSPYNFISEYVNSNNTLEAESRKPTNVGLSLKLTGDLLKPNINFNMAFPQLQGALKSYAETKLRLLQQDENELNKQAFGLIVVGSFLPTDIGVSQIRSGGINTLTETASNVVSNMLNKLVKEYVSGLDIQVGYNYYQYDLVDARNPLAIGGTGQQFRLRGSYALNDRLTISGGVGVDQGGYVQAISNSNVFVGSDFYLDYEFSQDRRLKLRVSYVRDQDIQGRRDKPAAGIRFQQEFDSFDELWKSLKIKKAVEKNKTDSIQ